MPHALVDIGVNLTHPQFDGDRDEVLARALGAGVSRMLLTGTSVGESRAAADLAATRPGVLWSTAGVHPHDASAWDGSSRAALSRLLARDEVVAVGECGLDFERDFSPRDDQRGAFAAQIDLAAARGLPLFVHERGAGQDVADALAARRADLVGAVVHCFTGERATLERYLSLDLHVGITGWICDERRGLGLRELVADVPDERLLVETDAPFLLPRTLDPLPKSRRNEPAYLPEVVAMVALCRGQSVEHVAACTSENAARLFGLG
ncbi:MAG: TatD family hydrolase [Planctomycetes bacterium]|nr:TatD family hydrolase [Planctomycetota bacterium]